MWRCRNIFVWRCNSTSVPRKAFTAFWAVFVPEETSGISVVSQLPLSRTCQWAESGQTRPRAPQVSSHNFTGEAFGLLLTFVYSHFTSSWSIVCPAPNRQRWNGRMSGRRPDLACKEHAVCGGAACGQSQENLNKTCDRLSCRDLKNATLMKTVNSELTPSFLKL